jgi:PBSX family phage terminase large subunit
MSAVAEPILLPYGEKAYDVAFTPPWEDARYTILEGSVRSAKTWALIPKIIALCKYPVKGWRIFTGVSKGTIYQNVLNDLFSIIGNENYGYNRQSGELDLFGTQWLVIGARDEGSEKAVRGLTAGVVVGDELTLLSQTFVKMLFNRMSVAGARAYFTTNPDTPFHWVKTDLLDNKALIASGDLRVIHFTLDDNPNLPPEYRAQLDRMYPPGSLYHLRFVKGLWVTGEGSIFKDVYSDALLYADEPWTMADGKPGTVTPRGLRDPGTIVERAIAVDCGVDHVQVYGDVIDDGTTLWFDREYWWDSRVTGRQKTNRQYADDLEEFTKKAPGAKVILPPECASFAEELTQKGMWHCDADNEVLDGIKNVATMMALRRIRFRRAPEGYTYDGGNPFHEHCGETIKQLQTYVWDPKARLRGVEQPLKSKDDGPDMVRYKVKTDIPAWRIAAV